MNIKNITKDLKTHTIQEVLQKYNITWQELIRIQTQQHPIKEQDTYRTIPKYIRKTEYNKYYIMKTKNGEPHYYGTYNTLYEAQIITDELIKHNWNKKILPLIYKKHNITK